MRKARTPPTPLYRRLRKSPISATSDFLSASLGLIHYSQGASLFLEAAGNYVIK